MAREAVHFTPPPSFRLNKKKTTIALSVSPPLEEGRSRVLHRQPSGLSVEVIFQKGLSVAVAEEGRRTLPRLVLVHGFSSAGASMGLAVGRAPTPLLLPRRLRCYAVSLLGQV
ncbi:putative pheophorbidase [Cocos nucifera]|uniref:Putative pheophorbidase n=1 Tax=Cocos nucifera TaxID=13894 RepID=A0A8K0MWQ9_COCNU|nr:putative pheophorbidase [Cocos nucifera]